MIQTNVRDGVAEIVMNRPPANALNLEFCTAIGRAHEDVCAAGARVIVLTGRPGMFSGGLDVPELLPLPRPAIEAFWVGFFRLTRALAASPVPVVAAVSGHAPAGGAILAIHCDYRIGVRGNFRIGLNEVAVGLPVPDCILFALEHLVGARIAQRLAMTAQLVTMDEALALGLVDELAEPERLAAQAREWAMRLAGLPPRAMNRTRMIARARLAGQLQPEADARLATELWFSDETQAGMRALVERLARK
jgi:enoyl-CoA hydratase/carnithine racemase